MTVELSGMERQNSVAQDDERSDKILATLDALCLLMEGALFVALGYFTISCTTELSRELTEDLGGEGAAHDQSCIRIEDPPNLQNVTCVGIQTDVSGMETGGCVNVAQWDARPTDEWVTCVTVGDWFGRAILVGGMCKALVGCMRCTTMLSPSIRSYDKQTCWGSCSYLASMLALLCCVSGLQFAYPRALTM